MAEYRNPLYNEVSPSVRTTLNNRGQLYGATLRAARSKNSDAGIMFPYGKTAYARVTTYKSNKDGSRSKSPLYVIGPPNSTATFPLGYNPTPSESGGATDDSSVSNQIAGKRGPALYSMSERNLPRYPILESVRVSNQGKMGSLQMATVTFKVYTPEQLDLAEKKAMTPGLEMDIEYGWSLVSGAIECDRTTFKGIVSNFSWTLNDDGSFDCSVDAVGKGFFGIGVPANATIRKDENEKHPKDKAGFDIKATNLATLIDKDIAEIEKKGKRNTIGSNGVEKPTGTRFLPDGIGWCVLSADTDGDKLKDESGGISTTESAKTPPEPKTFYYLTLNTIVNFFNTEVLSQSARMSKSLQYSVFYTDKDSGRFYGSPAAKDPYVVSCEPQTVLFNDLDPKGQSSYGGVHYKIGDANTANVAKDTITDFIKSGSKKKLTKESPAINVAYIWISTDAVKEAFNRIVEDKSTEPEYRSVTMFFDELFKLIAHASGDVYRLATFVDEKVEMNDADKPYAVYWIYDLNWAEHSHIEPYVFTRSIHAPLIRDLGMSNKLPGKMATQAYVGGRSGMNDEPSKPPLSDSSGAEDDHDKDDGAKIDSTEEIKQKIDKVKEQIGKLGISQVMTEQLYSLLRSYRANPDENATWVRNNLYPIELSITIDGIAGFRFGNVIKVDYMPQRYFERMVFVVTKVEHQIQNNDWTTSLTVQARLEKM